MFSIRSRRHPTKDYSPTRSSIWSTKNSAHLTSPAHFQYNSLTRSRSSSTNSSSNPLSNSAKLTACQVQWHLLLKALILSEKQIVSSYVYSINVLVANVFIAVAQQAIVNNKTKITYSQIQAFLQLCWKKFIKAKIEPGWLTIPLISLILAHSFQCRNRRRSCWSSVDWRTRNSNDVEDFPFRWCRFHERYPRSTPNQRDYQCR